MSDKYPNLRKGTGAMIYLCGCVVFTPLALWVIPQDRAAGWVLLIGAMVFGVLGIIGDLARTILMASHDAGENT